MIEILLLLIFFALYGIGKELEKIGEKLTKNKE